jgi:hypothetical protein
MLKFKDLNRTNQVRAINNVLAQHGAKYLAFLIESNIEDLFAWFAWGEAAEGFDFWVELKENAQ